MTDLIRMRPDLKALTSYGRRPHCGAAPIALTRSLKLQPKAAPPTFNLRQTVVVSFFNSPTVTALVAALATLGGAALTGWLGMRLQSRQAERQAATAAEERAELLRESRREERKAAYSASIHRVNSDLRFRVGFR